MLKKITTIEALALLTQNEFLGLHKAIREGFENTPSKGDLWELSTDIRQGFKELRDDMREIKVVLPPTFRTVAKPELDLKEHGRRLERIERKVGLAK